MFDRVLLPYHNCLTHVRCLEVDMKIMIEFLIRQGVALDCDSNSVHSFDVVLERSFIGNLYFQYGA